MTKWYGFLAQALTFIPICGKGWVWVTMTGWGIIAYTVVSLRFDRRFCSIFFFKLLFGLPICVCSVFAWVALQIAFAKNWGSLGNSFNVDASEWYKHLHVPCAEDFERTCYLPPVLFVVPFWMELVLLGIESIFFSTRYLKQAMWKASVNFNILWHQTASVYS